jgi:hypothetical protein
MELFPEEFVLELNTKIMGNSASFLTITHMTLSTKRFRRYGILTIAIAVVSYFRTEQRRNGSSILRLGLAETPKVLNIVFEGSSLNFPMV